MNNRHKFVKMITEYDSLSYFSEWRRISKFKKRKSRKKCWKQKKNEEYEYIYPDDAKISGNERTI
ncbi:hypothetical protein F230042K4_14730 [Mediterraneibacter glycyrrhizinilyticus]